jgi:NADPH-dependent 2,4-dienoyl-CoA reductase/sulfur reductase-like enzyme
VGKSLDVPVLIVGGGPAGAAAAEAARKHGIEALVADTRSGRPVSVRGGRLAVAEDALVREVNARAAILATGAGKSGEPQLSIAKALGCRITYDRALRHDRLVLDVSGETTVPGIFAAGAAASERDAVESGHRAGEAASARVGKRS